VRSNIIKAALAVSLLALAAATAGAAAAPAPQFWSFASAPALHPMRLRVTYSRPPGISPGYVFLDPFASGPMPTVGQAGALIVDGRGDPVWFHPAPAGQQIVDFRTQRLHGHPVLVWWQGTIAVPPKFTNLPAGAPEPGARYYIYNQHYRLIRTITARNGFTADLHELLLTPQGDALFIAAKTVTANLTRYGGSADGQLEDSAIQEINLRTGKLVFSWDMLDHVPLSEAQVAVPKRGVWDPYHMNSLQLLGHGRILFSARNTWAVYEISMHTGRIIWQLGGRGETITPAPNARFYWQHDARLHPGGQLSVFDDGCCNLPGGRPEQHAHGLILKLNFNTHRATVVHAYFHRPQLYVPSQGNVQELGASRVFIGWGQLPYYSEYTRSGRLLYDVRMPGDNESYRAFLDRWVGIPYYPPALAVRQLRGAKAIYASWNGSTQVAAWRLLGGSNPRHLQVLVARRARTGFQTELRVRTPDRYFKVQALNAAGRVLRASRIAHLAPGSRTVESLY
jgi:hypothetical protein